MSNDKNNWIVSQIKHLGLVITGAVLFAASFPNPVFIKGLPFLTWFSLIPILIVIYRSKLITCILWGAIYGFLSYALFNYWLGNFHPLAGTITYTIYSIYLVIVFVLLKLACIFFPKRAYLVQWVIWLTYEYLRTLGFLGYSYGVTGYSQWQMIPLIQIASITGVWGVSALITFPSFWLAGVLHKYFSQRRRDAENAEKEKKEKLKKETQINKTEKTSEAQKASLRSLRSLRLCEK